LKKEINFNVLIVKRCLKKIGFGDGCFILIYLTCIDLLNAPGVVKEVG
jgi:hypothetical protein